MTGDDQDLRDRFLALRREEEAKAPGFHEPSRPAHALGNGRPWVKRTAGFACLAASLAAVLWLARTGLMRPLQPLAHPTISITEWTAPTEFLMDTPGSKLLRTVPEFGADTGYGNALKPGRDPGQRRTRHPKTVLP